MASDDRLTSGSRCCSAYLEQLKIWCIASIDQLQRWLSGLTQTFGSELLLLLVASEHLLMGLLQTMVNSSTSFLFAAYAVEAQQMQVYNSILGLAGTLKPVIGLLSDSVPLCGYHKMSYMLPATILAVIALTVIGVAPPAVLSVGTIVCLLVMVRLQISTCHLLVEVSYFEQLREKPQAAPDLVSFVTAGKEIFNLLGATIVGATLLRFGVKAWQFLLASVLFAVSGVTWIFIVLAWKYAWLLQFLAFATTALFLFACSSACFVLFVVRLKWHCQDGLLQFLPKTLVDLLNQSVFELLHVANRRIILPLFDWLRLFLLVGFELNEDDRKQILNEMNREFREDVFQRPALRALPVCLQQVLLGRNWRPAPEKRRSERCFDAVPEDELSIPSRAPSGLEDDYKVVLRDEKEESTTPSRRRQLRERHNSIDQLQSILRRAEDASRTSIESTVVQKVLTEKLSDQAAYVLKGTATHQYDAVSPLVGQAFQAITTPPERLTLRVPWEVARINIKVVTVVWGAVFGARAPPVPAEEVTAEAKTDGLKAE